MIYYKFKKLKNSIKCLNKYKKVPNNRLLGIIYNVYWHIAFLKIGTIEKCALCCWNWFVAKSYKNVPSDTIIIVWVFDVLSNHFKVFLDNFLWSNGVEHMLISQYNTCMMPKIWLIMIFNHPYWYFISILWNSKLLLIFYQLLILFHFNI